MDRFLIMIGGLVGAVGVASAAAASHGDSRNLAAVAAIFLAHGPTLLALGLHGRFRPLLTSGWVIAAGTLVFGADLGVREYLGHSLFPGAAPLGGGAMILGWLGIAFGALAMRKN